MNGIIALLETYKYFILFPLAIIEGPFLTVIAGFLVTLGIMNAFIVLPVVVIGDAVGDSLLYVLGRFGSGLVHRYGYLLGITAEKLEAARNYYHNHHLRSVAQSKLIHGIGFVGIVAAGSLRVRYPRFAGTAFAISFLQSSVLLLIGIFFGYAYTEIAQYLTYFAATVSAIAIIVLAILLILYYRRKS